MFSSKLASFGRHVPFVHPLYGVCYYYSAQTTVCMIPRLRTKFAKRGFHFSAGNSLPAELGALLEHSYTT